MVVMNGDLRQLIHGELVAAVHSVVVTRKKVASTVVKMATCLVNAPSPRKSAVAVFQELVINVAKKVI